MSKKITAFLAFLAVGLPVYLHASAAAGQVAAAFLNRPVSTRATGMGEAFTGISDDDAAIFYDPAGMVQVDASLVSFMHLQGFAGVNYDYLAFVSPISTLGLDVDGAIGMSYVLLGMEPVQRTRADITGAYDQAYADRKFSFTAGGSVLTLSGAWQAGRLFSLGGSVKVIGQRIDDAEGTGVAGDLSLFTKPEYFPGLAAGIDLQNLGSSPDRGAPLPINLRAGVGYDLLHPFSNPDLPLDKFVFGADGVLPIVPVDAAMRFSVGGEYSRWFARENYIALRLGYRIPTDLGFFAGMTAGLGYGIEFPGTLVKVDYAWVPYGELGDSHRISLTAMFGLRRTVAMKGAREPLTAPEALRALDGGARFVELKWEAPKARIDGYNVYVAPDPEKGPWTRVNGKGLVTKPGVRTGGLENGKRYYFAVTSVQREDNKVVESSKSKPAAFSLKAEAGNRDSKPSATR